MSYTLAEALVQLQQRSTLAELIDLIQNTSARVEGAPDNATSLLYGGETNGQKSFELAETVTDSTAGNSGADRFVRVDETPVGQLLAQEDYGFIDKLEIAIKADLLANDPSFGQLSSSVQNNLVLSKRMELLAN